MECSRGCRHRRHRRIKEKQRKGSEADKLKRDIASKVAAQTPTRLLRRESASAMFVQRRVTNLVKRAGPGLLVDVDCERNGPVFALSDEPLKVDPSRLTKR